MLQSRIWIALSIVAALFFLTGVQGLVYAQMSNATTMGGNMTNATTMGGNMTNATSGGNVTGNVSGCGDRC
jgi:hypothetical protein